MNFIFYELMYYFVGSLEYKNYSLYNFKDLFNKKYLLPNVKRLK